MVATSISLTVQFEEMHAVVCALKSAAVQRHAESVTAHVVWFCKAEFTQSVWEDISLCFNGQKFINIQHIVA